MNFCGFCGSTISNYQCDWCEECSHLKKYCVCEPEAEFGDEDVDGFQDWDVSQEADNKMPAPRGFSGAKGN